MILGSGWIGHAAFHGSPRACEEIVSRVGCLAVSLVQPSRTLLVHIGCTSLMHWRAAIDTGRGADFSCSNVGGDAVRRWTFWHELAGVL